jgi:hypothetical protein
MAKAWKDVISTQQYQSLNPEQKSQAQEQYFNEVVAPQAGSDTEKAKQAFYSAYPSPAPQQTQRQPTQPEQSMMQQVGDWLTGGKSAGQIAEQAGRGLVNIPFDALQGGASLINALSQNLGGPKILDDVYRPVDRPTDPYAQAGETVGNYLTPGIGVAGNMALGSLADASNQQGDFAQNAAINAGVNLGAQGVLSGLAKAISPAASNAPSNAIKTANDISQLSRTAAGREAIASQAANVTDDVAQAANAAGVDVRALTPGMRSGSEGVAQAEGILSSIPGAAQDAHKAAFSEIATKLNQNLDDLGAAAGNASEKSAAIKQRVISNLDQMKSAEQNAWNDVRSTMPNQKMRMGNANAVVKGEKSAGVPLSPEMKQFEAANSKGGVTFDGMKAWRSKFADAEQKYIRSGEANAARRAGEVRRAITDDMQSMASKGGFLDDWSKANDLSKARISAQKDAESVFGRDLASDSLVTKGVTALQSSSKRGVNDFHKIMSAVPPAERGSAISSILQDAASHGVRGGTAEASGIKHIASILTPQNVNAISRYSPEVGRIADAYGKLARAATKPLQYVEQTGRSAPALEQLNAGMPKILQTIINAAGNSATGSIVGLGGGGMPGAVAGAVASTAIKSAAGKIATKRSGRYAIEKAIQEASKAVQSGGGERAVSAAEKRFLSNSPAVKALRDTLSTEEFNNLSRAGIVATLSGMNHE